MKEVAEPQRRTRDEKSKKNTEREHHAVDERYEAARRWIGDDDDAAIRGID